MCMCTLFVYSITESVDSVCRDGTDMPYVQYKQKPGKLPQKHEQKLSKVPDLHHGATRPSKLLGTIAEVPNWKSAKVPNCSSSFFFLEKAYLMTAVSSNCAFSTKGQHFLARRSTVP